MNLLFTIFLTTASAAKKKVEVEPVLDLWFAHDQTTAFPVNTEGTQGGQKSHIDMRQKLGAVFKSGDVAIHFALGGDPDQIWGSKWNVPGTIDERNRNSTRLRFPDLRKLSLVANLAPFQIETGLTTAHWGLGMMANDGEHEPFFGHTEFGDRVIRARLTTKPSQDSDWYFTAAWDRVLQDDLTLDAQTQWTTQAIFSALWKNEANQAGINGIIRRQDEMIEGRTTGVTAVDAFTELTLPVSEGVNIHIGAEAAGVTGKTNRTTTYNSPNRLHILSSGGTAYGMFGFLDDSLKVGVSSGYASGDGDPNDDTIHDFTFDRNFGVGMVIFDEVMSAIDASHYTIVNRPEYAGQPPDGVEASVHEGAFRRASYLQPRFEYSPIPQVRLRGGVLLAWATAPISHGFYTHRNGGSPVNHLGQATKGYGLGTEYNWSLQLQPFANGEHLFRDTRLSVQGGHAILDSNMGGDRMGQIDRYIIMLHVL